MDQQILNQTITIEEVIDKGKKLSIKGNNGTRTNTYSIWKTKQDGTDSATYAQYKNMSLTVGSKVFIGYVIDEFDANIQGQAKRVRSNKIINFREPSLAPYPDSQTVKASHSEAPTHSQSHSSDAFGRRLGVQGHINALLSNPNYYGPEATVSITDLIREAIAIEDEAEKQLNPSQLRQAVQKHVSFIDKKNGWGGQLITCVKTEAAAGKLIAELLDHSDRALMQPLADLFQDYAPPNAADYNPDFADFPETVAARHAGVVDRLQH